MNYKALVIGGNHHNTLGVIRALGDKGIQSVLLLVTEEKRPYVSFSKYIDECILLKSKQEIVPFLLSYAKKQKETSESLSPKKPSIDPLYLINKSKFASLLSGNPNIKYKLKVM